MAAPKRTPEQVASDRQKLARLYLRNGGLTQQEMADRLNDGRPPEAQISRQMVAVDIKAIIKLWQDSAIDDISKKVATQLARIDHLEAEAWEAWERSKQDQQERLTTGSQEGPPVLDPGGNIQYDRMNLVVRKDSKQTYQLRQRGQAGDPRFHDTIKWCIAERSKLWGLYAPTKIAVEELDELIEAELRRLRGEQLPETQFPNDPTTSSQVM